MAKTVEKVCKTLLKSMFKKCVQKCGKIFYSQKGVDKISCSQCFTKSFHMVLNILKTPVKHPVFHVLHIAYNYNY